MKKFVVVLGAILVVVIGTALAADWRFLRGTVERLASQQLGVPVSLAGFRMSLLPRPHLSFEGLRIPNPPGARNPDVVRIDQAEVTLALWPALQGKVVVDALALRGGELFLTRDRHGNNNWTIANLPAQQHLRSVEFDHMQINYDDVQNDLLANLRIGRNPDRQAAKTLPLSTEFDGLYQNIRYRGTLVSGHTFGLRDSDRPLPFKLNATAGQTRLSLEGEADNLLDEPTVQARVDLSGPSLGQLYPFLGIPLPATGTYTLRSRLHSTDGRYTLDEVVARLGQTDLSGTATWQARNDRPLIEANLRSQTLDARDLEQLLGAPSVRPAPRGPRPARVPASVDMNVGVLPDLVLMPDALRNFDADITLDTSALRSGKRSIENVKLHAKLEDQVLTLEPFTFFYAGGDAKARWQVDGRTSPATVSATLELHKARLNRVAEAPSAWRRSNGTLGVDLTLQGQGDTLRTFLDQSNGSIGMAMAAGDMSTLIADFLGNEASRMLGLSSSQDRRGPQRCTLGWAQVRSGTASIGSLVLDTAARQVQASGTVQLGKEQVTLRFAPQRRPDESGVPSGVDATGSFSKLQVGPPKARQRVAVADAATARPRLQELARLVETGSGKDSGCAALFAAPLVQPSS